MKISVIIPTMGNVGNLSKCLASLKNQTLKPNDIVVVGKIGDVATKEVTKKFGARFVEDKKKTIGNAYYAGVNAASGDLLAFIDDDAFAPKDWLMKISKDFEKEDIDVVGGEDLLPPGSSFFQSATYQIDLARMGKEPLYGKKAFSRLRATNITYRSDIFKREAFDTELTGLQEPELHHRLVKCGFKAKFNPDIIVYHKRRESIRDIFFQIYRNGKAKISLIKKHPGMISVFDIAPFIYVAVFLLTLYLMKLGWPYPLYSLICITIAYFLLKPLGIVLRTKKRGYYCRLIQIVFVREAAYMIGIIVGLRVIFKH
jgi:GT2 family glycosyltransferase